MDKKKNQPHVHHSGHNHEAEKGKAASQSKTEKDDHEHGGIFGKNTEMIFAIICAVALAIGYGLTFMNGLPAWSSLAFYILAYFFGGFFTAKEAVETIAKGGFEIDFLMLIAAIGAAILGSWAEGALLLALFSLGHALEHYAMGRARKSIEALTDLAPPEALVVRDGKERMVPIEMLVLGDVIIIKPNSKIPQMGL